MNQSIILHHYELSPYAEKIRLMFGLTDSHWNSLLSPAWPPRPNLDPLTGGYRRIPVAQIGADIFCDTAVIATEVAALTGQPELDPKNSRGEPAELMQKAEQEVFFAAITAVPPWRTLRSMLKIFGPIGMMRFAKDRAGLSKGGNLRAPGKNRAPGVLKSYFEALDARLTDNAWIGGASATVADLACYHPLWLHRQLIGSELPASANVQRWYDSVSAIGHGTRQDISQSDAFTEAKAEPRALPASVDNPPVALGKRVAVAPEDYGVVAVTGRLAAVTGERIIVARDTDDFGALHVHFPRQGYSIKTL